MAPPLVYSLRRSALPGLGYNRPAMKYPIIVLLVVIFLVLVGVRVWRRLN